MKQENETDIAEKFIQIKTDFGLVISTENCNYYSQSHDGVLGLAPY